MATAATPYGLIPVQMLGGQVMTHGLRKMKIASGYATSIFHGDLVKRVTAGLIEKDTGTTTALPVGIFLGVSWTDSTYGPRFQQYWPASTVASDAMAFVCDDPFQLFQVQASATLGQSSLGCNVALVQGSGSTSTGKSGVTINAATIANTATLPLRIVDYVTRPGSSELGDTYTDVLVKINTHFYLGATGTAAA